jgi:hypothetical protein
MPLFDALLWTTIIAALMVLTRAYFGAGLFVMTILPSICMLLYCPRCKRRWTACVFWTLFVLALLPVYVASVGPFVLVEKTARQFVPANAVVSYDRTARKVREVVYLPVVATLRSPPLAALHAASLWSQYQRHWIQYYNRILYPEPAWP